MSRGVPTVRPISWLATIPQFLALFGAIGAGWAMTRTSNGIIYGAAVYLLYSFGSRSLLTGAHRRGIRLLHQHRFEDAIKEFESSNDFFSRHRWLDDYRSIFMMSPAAMSYRELAIVNIAFAYAQLGDRAKAIEFYRRALDEFPKSPIARAALQVLKSDSQPTTS